MDGCLYISLPIFIIIVIITIPEEMYTYLLSERQFNIFATVVVGLAHSTHFFNHVIKYDIPRKKYVERESE